jgi:chaperonin cofactor prefoldin
MADISKDRLKARIKALENIVESLDQHVAMLQNDLYNERLRNENLERLVTSKPGSKTIED